MRRFARFTIAATLAGTLVFAAPAEARSAFAGLAVGDARFYIRLAQCETGSNFQHETRSYTSGFGIAKGVWMRYSHSSTAKNATPREQAIVVDRIAFLGFDDGRRFWHPVGPWGWGAIKKQNCMQLQSFICRSKRAEVARWKRHC
jgi:hypothetical protein